MFMTHIGDIKFRMNLQQKQFIRLNIKYHQSLQAVKCIQLDFNVQKVYHCFLPFKFYTFAVELHK